MAAKILFINACFREGSRTAKLTSLLADKLFAGQSVTEINLGDMNLKPMDRDMLAVYNESVAGHSFTDPMFDYAKQFKEADEIVKQFDYIKAEGLDVWGADVDQIIREAAGL